MHDLDEHRRALLARRSLAKNKTPVWTELRLGDYAEVDYAALLSDST